MFAGFALFGIIIYLAILLGIIVFAVKVLQRLKEISQAQQAIAQSQAQIVTLMSNQQAKPDNAHTATPAQ